MQVQRYEHMSSKPCSAFFVCVFEDGFVLLQNLNLSGNLDEGCTQITGNKYTYPF